MAEVAQRLCGGFRLRALTSRSVCTSGGPAYLPGNSHGSVRAETAANLRQRQLTNGTIQDAADKVCRRRKSEHGRSCCFSSLDLDCYDCNRSVKSRERLQEVFLPAGVQEELFHVRMASWSRRVATLSQSQQLRAFCTITFVLAEPGSDGSRLRRLKVQAPSSTRRCYTKEAAPLYRSRTAYYDVLRVTPAATQSQIKTAYYKQSFIYHPDKNPGSQEATQHFSQISEAYTVLGNIGLRRKYDRGILSQSDINGAGRPSSRPTASTHQQQQQQHRARRFSQSRGKTMFDFDAFYQAHYGEQLQREQAMRARKQHLEEEQRKIYQQWKKDKMMELTVAALLALAGIILFRIT